MYSIYTVIIFFLIKLSILFICGQAEAAPTSGAEVRLDFSIGFTSVLRIILPNIRPAEHACRRNDVFHQTAQLTNHPHLAYISYKDNNRTSCGGVLIDKRFVLTVAHCIEAEHKPAQVHLGKEDLWINITETYVHPSYSNLSNYYDIGLIKLAQDVEYSATIFPVCLETVDSDLPSGMELSATGFERNGYSVGLREMKIRILSTDNCNKTYANYMDRYLEHAIDETHLCVKAVEEEYCEGFSGGHILLRNISFGYICQRVVGLDSFGIACGMKPSEPRVFTKISKYIDFIEKIVWPHF